MKKYIFMAVAAMAALSSCSDNEIIGKNPITDGNEVAKPSLVFTATMEDAPQTRATFNSTYKCAEWEVNDKISINGKPFFAGSNSTSTTFMAPATQEVRPEYVHSYSSGFDGQGPEMLVDEGGTETKWCADKKFHFNESSSWDIIVKTAAPTKLQAIKLWNGDDTWAGWGYRRWTYVMVWGWTSQQWYVDRPDWEVIKTFENLILAYDLDNLFAGTLEVNATKEYEYYKVEILDNVWDDIMQMSDMKFVYGSDNSGGDQALSMDDAPFHAYFPAALYDGSTATLPANIAEDWADGRFNMPMYAESETTDLKFKNLCGVLKITIKSDDLASVRSIKVSSSNHATSGAFAVNAEGAAVLSTPDDVAKTVTVTYTTPVETTAEGKVFYVAIPAQTYQDLKIKITDGVNDKYMVTKSGTDIVVERNKIYSIDFVGNFDYSTSN